MHSRRRLLTGMALAPLALADLPFIARADPGQAIAAPLAALETETRGRLGLVVLTAAGDVRVSYRGDERFAFCSTFKVLVVGEMLERSVGQPRFLERRIAYSERDLVHHSPITERHVGAGMSLAQLCMVALQFSDNSAANLLMRELGGPAGVTSYARSLGDDRFNLTRWETELNSAIPGEERDTTTPLAMARDLWGLTLGNALPVRERQTLVGWMRANTTGHDRIAAGLPRGWTSIDKTGTGDYGTTNDIALVKPASGPDWIVVAYFTQATQDARSRSDVLASATRIAVSSING